MKAWEVCGNAWEVCGKAWEVCGKASGSMGCERRMRVM